MSAPNDHAMATAEHVEDAARRVLLRRGEHPTIARELSRDIAAEFTRTHP